MKYLFSALLILMFGIGYGQNPTALSDDLSTITNWDSDANGVYDLSETGSDMQILANKTGTTYDYFTYSFSALDLTSYPYLQIDIKASSTLKVRIDLVDNMNNVTNTSAVLNTINTDQQYHTYYFNFTGKFSQTYPSTASVNGANITKIFVYLNPGNSTFTNYAWFDNLKIGSAVNIPPPPAGIWVNQVGFYIGQPKIGVAAQVSSPTFTLLAQDKQTVVYTGNLVANGTFAPSREAVKIADFTSFNTPGTYYLSAGGLYSQPFKILPQVNNSLTKGLLKSYYFNRASTAISSTYGGQWARAAGHPDNIVYVHSSASGGSRAVGSTFASPKGWYDAGDYNKYVVNSGISTYTILSLYEHYPAYFDTLKTNIPESSNEIPDVLDEALWNINWLLTTQDPVDGSVYHKISQLQFGPDNQMPAADGSQRYAIGRSTAAALDFAAVMAQASRIFRKFDTQLPGFADQCLNASIKAYNWALSNPSRYFSNPSDVGTGSYGDGNVSDEFIWAKLELYAATRNDNIYSTSILNSGNFGVPGWPNVATLGLMTFVNYRKQLNTAGYADTTLAKNKLLSVANSLRSAYTSSPYKMVIGQNNEFFWGSNAVAGNQSLVLLQAFRLTNDSSYFKAALSNLDYLLGRNPTGNSYVTGFGNKSTLNPHHRLSNSDGVAAPVPGMVVGGANMNEEDGCVGYPSNAGPAASYLDAFCSYATNEPAINYTAPVAYTAGALDAIVAGASYTPEATDPPADPVNPLALGILSTSVSTIAVSVYPNPTKTEVSVEFENKGNGRIRISDLTGKVMMEEPVSGFNTVSKKLDISHLPSGIYTVVITNDEGAATRKLVKE